MTSKQMYDAVQIELNKENAPNVLLEDFNYFANKAINQYINKRYNIYDINQQTTDDLRVLKATSVLVPHKVESIYDGLTLSGKMATFYVDLPSDYLHLLNCIVIYNVRKTYKCYNRGDTWRAAATRLTSDAYSQVLDNFWMKPSYKRPYYYVHNINTTGENEELTSNPYDKTTQEGVDANFEYETKKYSFVIKPDYDHMIIPLVNAAGSQETGGQLNLIVSSEHPYYSGPIYLGNDAGQLVSENKALIYDSNAKEFKFTGNILSNGVPQTAASISNGIVHYQDVEAGNVDVYFYAKESDAITNLGTEEERDQDEQGNDIISISNEMFSKNYGHQTSNIERAAKLRYGNASKVRLEIRYGTDSSVFDLTHREGDRGGYVYIDYIKAPQFIRLTQEELDHTEDYSQTLEFPDYVCQEIINELVLILMENSRNQRVSTHPVVSQSIANPTQAQAPEAAGQSA